LQYYFNDLLRQGISSLVKPKSMAGWCKSRESGSSGLFLCWDSTVAATELGTPEAGLVFPGSLCRESAI